MEAFFVHDKNKQLDLLVVPETDNIVLVNREILEGFIAVMPDFSQYSGEPLNGLKPESLGVVVATRKSEDDVCIAKMDLWHQRMGFYLNGPQ